MPEKHHKKPAHQSGPDENSKPTEHCKIDAGTVYSVRVQPDSKDQERYTEEKEYRRRQLASGRTLNIVTAVAAGFALIYAAITYLQWQELRHNFTIDERAWIEVKDTNTSSKLSDYRGAHTHVVMSNFGKSPALNIRVRTAGEILPANTPPSLLYGRGVTVSTGDLFPGVPLDITVGDTVDMTEQQRQSLETGRSYLAMYGVAQFSDIFGKEHATTFCVWRAFGKSPVGYAAKPCTDYNSVDAQ